MSNSPVKIGLIYAKWCGSCHALKPQWDLMKLNIAKKIKNKEYKISPTYMNIEDKNLHLIDEFNKKHVNDLANLPLKHNGFPTIFRIKNGRIDYYTGDRNADVMEKWFMGNTHSISRKNIHRGGCLQRTRKTRKQYRTKTTTKSRHHNGGTKRRRHRS